MTTKYYHGPTQAAYYLGVTRQSIHNWRKEGTFPDPDADVDGKPGWTEKTLDALLISWDAD